MKHKTRVMYLLAALFAALTAICSQIQIPLPMVPINMALFSVLLAGALLGARMAGIAILAYVLLGAAGAPVFAGMQGGIATLFGKTGGYILGYILTAVCVGALVRVWGKGFWKQCAAMAIGTIACYAVGTIWFLLITGLPLWTSLVYCVFPFLIGDIMKILLAAFLSGKLQRFLPT